MARSRAGAARRGSLVAVSVRASEPSRAERELSALLARLSELEAETADISDSLARFRDERRARLAAAEAELHAARRLEERMLRLQREAEEWALGPPPSESKKRRRPSRSALPPLSIRSNAEDDAVAPWLPLKELYRMLARKLHPDLGTSDVERARRSELMARVNAAYAREDRVLLELILEEAESGAGAAEPSSERRAGHAERRLATIAPLVASLEKGLARLRASSSFKELLAARRAAEQGRDFFGEATYATRKAARESLRNALLHAARLDATLRVYRARSVAPPARRSPRRRPDEWPGERLLRDAERSDEDPPTDESRRVAARVEALAAGQKWQVVLSLFALFAEASAVPPPALSTFAGVRATYEMLAAGDPSAPAFDRALVDLPAHLELGIHAYPRRLVFGIQVKRPEHLAGLRLALSSSVVQQIATAVLAAMGPVERCHGCGQSRSLVHMFRARGIDEVHALACPGCGVLQRSYRTIGGPEGLEALAPYAVALGLVIEQAVVIGGSTVVLGLLQHEARGFDAKFIVDRLATLLLDEVDPELRRHAQLTANRRVLAPSARVQPGTRLRLVLRKAAPLSAKELERELLARTRSRFRVPSQGGRSRRRS